MGLGRGIAGGCGWVVDWDMGVVGDLAGEWLVAIGGGDCWWLIAVGGLKEVVGWGLDWWAGSVVWVGIPVVVVGWGGGVVGGVAGIGSGSVGAWGLGEHARFWGFWLIGWLGGGGVDRWVHNV